MTLEPAHVLWQQLNQNKYQCDTCKFRSFNAAHYIRHINSAKHFLLTTFATECPRDLKILIESFLPLFKIFKLPEPISRPALRLAWKRHPRYQNCPRAVLPHLTLGPSAFQPIVGLHVTTVVRIDRPGRNGRNRAFWLAL